MRRLQLLLFCWTRSDDKDELKYVLRINAATADKHAFCDSQVVRQSTFSRAKKLSNSLLDSFVSQCSIHTPLSAKIPLFAVVTEGEQFCHQTTHLFQTNKGFFVYPVTTLATFLVK